MMTLNGLITSRRSIRDYLDKEVEKKHIVQIIDAAIWAPSAGNLQLLHYVVIQNKKTLDKIKLFAPGMPKTAPSCIAICVDIKEAETKGGALIRKSIPIDAGLAAQNILLKAYELGIGSCVVKSYNEKSINQILKLPEKVTALIIITLGYYEKLPKTPKRKKLPEAVHYESWNSEVMTNE